MDSFRDQLGMSKKRLISEGRLDCSRITQTWMTAAAEVVLSGACTIWMEYSALMFDMLRQLHDHTLEPG